MISLFSTLWNPERAVLRALSAESDAPQGMDRALERSVFDLEPAQPLPSVRIFPNPIPLTRVVRGPRSAGTILLSRGLVSILDEAELQSVLRKSFLLSRQSGLTRKSYYASVSAVLMRWAGVSHGALTPWKAVRGWAFLPAAFLFSRASRDLDVFASADRSKGSEEVHWSSATHKISRYRRMHKGSSALDLIR